MTELKIFDNPAFGQVRTILKDNDPWFVAADVGQLPKAGSSPWHGYVYAIEYGDGIKIGHTTNLQSRKKAISRMAANYSDLKTGLIAHTKEHTNHKEVENQLHKFFAAHRTDKSERFAITLDEFLSAAPELILLDESIAKREKSEALCSSLVAFATGGLR